MKLYHSYRYRKLSELLGFSIGINTLGYGVVIPHWGTIVIGSTNRVGKYAVLHTSTCITSNGKEIGDALYLSTGAILTAKLKLGDNVSIGANSLVNKSFPSNVLLVGSPAYIKGPAEPWYIRDNVKFANRVKKIEDLRSKLNL